MSFALGLAGTVVTIAGSIWAFITHHADWRKRLPHADYPPTAIAKRILRLKPRRASQRVRLGDPTLTVFGETLAAPTLEPISPDASELEQVEARLRGLERWRDYLAASVTEIRGQQSTDREARLSSEQRLHGSIGQLVEKSGEDLSYYQQEKSGEFWGILLALAGAAMSGVAALLP